MRKCVEYKTDDAELFKQQVVQYASQQKVSCVLNSNSFDYPVPGLKTNSQSFLAALHPLEICNFNYKEQLFDSLFSFWESKKDWIFGHFAYDLKNEIENLSSAKPDNINFPQVFFFMPSIVIEESDNIFKFWHNEELTTNSVNNILHNIQNIVINKAEKTEIKINSRFNKEEYLNIVNKLKYHIQQGDIYEINFCQEFFTENTNINPAALFNKICQLSPAPFSCFYKVNDSILISASPERFLKKTGNQIISQPMKGTSRKAETEKENLLLKKDLSESKKERAENIMIVDIVRNDLSRTAMPESVNVEELCGIYEFPQVYQMISTISSKIPDDTKFTEVIRSAFPMGSMTGAPKIRAMELIELYERTKRGLYSGSVGYITPDGDFDFNVVIRSIQYNSISNYLSFITGGAITSDSEAENEYDECILKAKGILLAINGKLV